MGNDGPLQLDPSEIHLSPSTPTFELELRNRGQAALPIQDIRFEGEDWMAFAITDPSFPKEVPAGEAVHLHGRVSPRPFRIEDAKGNLRGYRAAHGELRFTLDGTSRRIPLHFDAPSPWLRHFLPSTIKLCLALALFSLLGRIAKRPDASATASPPSTLSSALSSVALFLALCTLPLGDAWCWSGLLEAPGPRAIAQCREALGGTPASILDFPFAFALLPLFLATSAAFRLFARPEAFALFSLRIARITIASLSLAALFLSTGTSTPFPFALGDPLSIWKHGSSSIAFLLFLCAALSEEKKTTHFLQRMVWSGWFTVAWLGGWKLFGLALPAPAQLSVLVGKMFLVEFGLRKLSAFSSGWTVARRAQMLWLIGLPSALSLVIFEIFRVAFG